MTIFDKPQKLSDFWQAKHSIIKLWDKVELTTYAELTPEQKEYYVIMVLY